MQLFPTRKTVHVALAALGTVTAGVLLRLPAVAAWGGAMIAGLAIARATAKLAVLRVRAAGLEMVWRAAQKVRKVARSTEVLVEVELKNRDLHTVHYASLRAIASSELEVTLEPTGGSIAGAASAALHMTVRAPRVGRYCIHGLALEVRGPPGLFEVPLAFANPIGIEVFPRSILTHLTSARGGRSKRQADTGAANKRPGAGSELYELREHVMGNPFKRIAWRASARRGKLMVREFEREDRDVVWLVLDTATDLLAGPLGASPLDRGIDEMAAIAARHLARGDRVGLASLAMPPRSWIAPGKGTSHALKIAKMLVGGASFLDADRSDYDEHDVARRVLDHLRFLDASSVAQVRAEQIDLIVAHAEAQRVRAPHDLPAPFAKTAREQTLRRYLACYGISSPPRVEQDHTRAMGLLVQALDHVIAQKPRASLVYVFSRAPELPAPALSTSIRKMVRRNMSVRWLAAREDVRPDSEGELAAVVSDAVSMRAKIARERGERFLRGLGVKIAAGSSGRGAHA